MQVACYPETLVPIYQSVLCKIPEDCDLNFICILASVLFSKSIQILSHTAIGLRNVYMKETRIARSLQRPGYELNSRGIRVRYPSQARDFSLIESLQIGSRA
jgi:hypothetical protein